MIVPQQGPIIFSHWASSHALTIELSWYTFSFHYCIYNSRLCPWFFLRYLFLHLLIHYYHTFLYFTEFKATLSYTVRLYLKWNKIKRIGEYLIYFCFLMSFCEAVTHFLFSVQVARRYWTRQGLILVGQVPSHGPTSQPCWNIFNYKPHPSKGLFCLFTTFLSIW